MKYHYITVKADAPVKGKKTLVYRVVNNKWGDELGQIRWYGPWRAYCFFVGQGRETVWSAGCLRDIQDAMNKIDKQRRIDRGWVQPVSQGETR